jgi:hypothetical protein
VIAMVLPFVVLDAGQWSDQSASHALVTEGSVAEKGTLLYLSGSVEVAFANGAQPPELLGPGRIVLAIADVGVFVLFTTTDRERNAELYAVYVPVGYTTPAIVVFLYGADGASWPLCRAISNVVYGKRIMISAMCLARREI